MVEMCLYLPASVVHETTAVGFVDVFRWQSVEQPFVVITHRHAALFVLHS